MIKRIAYNSLVLALKDLNILDKERSRKYLLSNKTENNLMEEVYKKYGPKKLEEVINRQVDVFTKNKEFKGDLEENLRKYHNFLEGHTDVYITRHGPNILIDINECPYSELCKKYEKIPCIKEISLKRLMERSGIKDHKIEVEKGEKCKIVVYKVQDKEIAKLDEMIREMEELSGKINVLELFSREYQQSNEDFQ